MPLPVCRRTVAVAVFFVFGVPAVGSDPKPADATVVERLKKDLFYLAGPELAGRASGSKEIEKAADYVAAAFKDAGLKPAGKDGSYFQPFPVLGPSVLGTPVSVKLTGPDQALALKFPAQFTPTGQSGSGKLSGGLVFAGYGITSTDKPAYDDYKGIDAKGKVVVILRRTPMYDAGNKNPFGFEGGTFSQLTAKVRT